MAKPLSILWLPGLLCDSDLFKEVNQALPSWVEPDVVDLPILNSMPDLAKAIIARAPEQFILGGLSMGGILAFEIYRQAPEKVLGLILMDTNAADEKINVTQGRDQLVAQALNGQFSEITPQVLLPKLIAHHRLNDKPLTERVNLMAENVGVDAFVAHAQALASRSDSRSMLGDISVPTLVICGKEDVLCPLDNHLLMAKHIPQVSLQVIPHCGHLSSMENPTMVAKHITNWLQSFYH